ncbi:MAG: 3-dehydroquinate synthase [Planctomycetes bacterium]|nr:3-dehydroquinate synthase [Planctomycetota bacterium]
MNANPSEPAGVPAPVASHIVRVSLGERSYEIQIQAGLLADLGSRLLRIAKGRRLLVVTDRTIGPLFGPVLARSLQAAGFDGSLAELPPGEGAKSLDVAKFLYDRCFDAQLDRSSCLVALGGGVMGDLTGFVAATYMRGIDFVQVPTTLLSMVDASVGGKVAVDHPRAKNAIGAFHQPRAVFIDPLVLAKLPDRELKAGLAEVIKYGVLDDRTFFEFVESNVGKLLQRDAAALSSAIEKSCAIKARIVGEDEREREGGPRALLNLGHTFAHAIETCTNYQGYLHGEAVAIGMAMACELSVARKLLSRGDADRVRQLIELAGLPVKLKAGDPPADDLHAATFRDKKARGGKLRFVLATSIGTTKVFDDVPEEAARKIWDLPRD